MKRNSWRNNPVDDFDELTEAQYDAEMQSVFEFLKEQMEANHVEYRKERHKNQMKKTRPIQPHELN